MLEARFEQFSTLISGIYRDIQKLKAKWTAPLGMKAVHIFWVYLLKNHPELIDLGYVQTEKITSHRRYGQKLTLTQSGADVARFIGQTSLDIQKQVNAGIPEEDLEVLYRTLGILMENFHRLAEQTVEE